MILLDFWYKDCPPCIKSVASLKKINAQYSDKLSIVSFSIDPEKVWLEALERDKPTWLSLWDGKGRTGATIAQYAVNTYPTFYLIGPDGKIIFKEEGYGTLPNGDGVIDMRIKSEVEKYLRNKL